ncbi:unnamed protein product [Boreogadus saida]
MYFNILATPSGYNGRELEAFGPRTLQGLSLPLLPFVIYCKPSCCGGAGWSPLRLPLPGVMESSARWLMPLEPSAIPSAYNIPLYVRRPEPAAAAPSFHKYGSSMASGSSSSIPDRQQIARQRLRIIAGHLQKPLDPSDGDISARECSAPDKQPGDTTTKSVPRRSIEAGSCLSPRSLQPGE